MTRRLFSRLLVLLALLGALCLSAAATSWYDDETDLTSADTTTDSEDFSDTDAAAAFSDVPATQWYYEYVDKLYASGVVGGFPDGTFRPNDALTRAQAAVMLCAFAAFTQDDVTARADLSAYSDAGQIPSWAMDAMQWANARRLIVGRDSSHLAPNSGATRAEMAAILSAYIGK